MVGLVIVGGEVVVYNQIVGMLRNLLSKFIKFKPDPNLVSPICTHPNLPEKQQHTNLVVNAHDNCQSCSQRICLVCSEVHVQNHCVLDIKTNKDIGQGTLRDFNLGYLMQLPLAGLKCICGKPLNHDPNHAICAACGLASCSEECHSHWQAQGNCTYSSNYFEKPKGITMRSILFSNIRNIQLAKINEWNLACKSALSYIACYAKSNANYVYLQRGYRNYGVPQPELVSKMRKVDFGLDYTTHIERVCQCTCEVCRQRGFHSIGNCEHSCLQMKDYNEIQWVDDAEMYHECSCDCKFCQSGIVVTRHTKFDCGLHCYKSHYNTSKLEKE